MLSFSIFGNFLGLTAGRLDSHVVPVANSRRQVLVAHFAAQIAGVAAIESYSLSLYELARGPVFPDEAVMESTEQRHKYP